MNIIDVIIILFAIMTLMRGADVGLVRQAFSLLGLIVGLVVGSFIATVLDAGLVVSVLLIALSLVAALGAGEYFGIRLKQVLHTRHINKVDRLFGSVMGVFIALAFVWFASTLVSAVPSPELQKGVRDSRIIAWLDKELPPVTDITKWFERSFAQTKLPELIRELEPSLPNQNAELPDINEFSSVIASAKESVVQIEGRSCKGLGVGSGYVAADGIVITNAHVVAGMLHPYVQDDNGRHSAEVIGFNPDLDLAILRVNNLAGEPLVMLDDFVDVGTKSVALGYPGGEDFTASPGVVIERFTAVGRDIYDQGVHRRSVYALKADVREGNSGGPLLDQTGTVIGVIFARSTSYESIGYALTTPTVVTELAKAQTSPSAGESTRCAAL